MRIKMVPGDFVVEERIDLRLAEAGPWAVYRIRKVGLATLELQTRLAGLLHVSRRQIVFPALKDKEAIAIQFAALPARAPELIQGEGFTAQRIGFRRAPLSPSDLRGNTFTVTLRELAPKDADHVARRLDELAQCGLPNYFDDQRFGSFPSQGDSIGKRVLQRDATGALRAYLAEPFRGDPRAVRAFKRRAAALWPDWRAIFGIAPKPSNFRSVLTFLVDHPHEHRKAINLIPQRLLALYLAAYQSFLWNRILAGYLAWFYDQRHAAVSHIEVAGQLWPIHIGLDGEATSHLAALRLPLPHHRTDFRGTELEPFATRVFQDEGIAPGDLKARILRQAYLSRGERPALLLPGDTWIGVPETDRYSAGLALRLGFTLPSGAFATLVLKASALGLCT